MPVMRVSDQTWERLKRYARPLEDKAEDVVKRALDALDEAISEGKTQTTSPPSARTRSRKGKTPQKAFRHALLATLCSLGGSATVADVRKTIEPRIASHLRPGDHDRVSTGDPRWWNAVCWERMDCVREGLLVNGSPRGVWAITDKGKRFVAGEAMGSGSLRNSGI